MINKKIDKRLTENGQSRRGFFRSLAQLAIGTGLLATGGVLLSRRQPADGCTADLPCSQCGKSSHCALPQAVSYRVSQPEAKTDSRMEKQRNESPSGNQNK